MSHRTQITLSDEQYELLVARSGHDGVSLAELVRRAIDRTYGSCDRASQRAALESSFAAWGPGEDGERFVDQRRRGMQRRLAATER